MFWEKRREGPQLHADEGVSIRHTARSQIFESRHNFLIGGGTGPTAHHRAISLDRHETGKTTPSQGRPAQLTRIDEINKNLIWLRDNTALFPGNQVRNEVARLAKEKEELGVKLAAIRNTAPTGEIQRFDKGGAVKKTGLAVVHKGEYVVTAKDNLFNLGKN